MPAELSDMEKVFLEVLERNQKALYKICWMFGKGDLFHFQELKVEVFTAIWDEIRKYGLGRFCNQSKESTWLCGIAFYVSLSYTRSLQRHERVVSLTDCLPEPSLDSSDQEDAQYLNQLLAMLDEDDRRWIMYYMDGYHYKDISEQEGISESAARKRMSRIIKKLRKLSND